MPSLHLRGLTMAFGRRLLFTGVNAEVAPGRCLAVTGANGAGKSTLLRIIAGLLRPEAGAVVFDGARGYAAPDVQAYVELTGLENLAFFARLRGLADADLEGLLARGGLPRDAPAPEARRLAAGRPAAAALGRADCDAGRGGPQSG